MHRRFVEGKPEMLAMLEEERANVEVAGLVYRLRDEAGLTQQELAEKVGASASAICLLEDADYQGHSLALLRRIAAAVGKRVVIGFVDAEPTEEPLQQEREPASV
jgi:DNA-binding XRE family transcriptional regulator